MRAGSVRTGALGAALSVLLVAAAHGQVPPPQHQAPARGAMQLKPVTGFVTPYEILRTVSEAGFHPLVRPLREGTVYVLRATDFRGILVRVVLDAGTGRMRDVTRLEPADSIEAAIAPPPYYNAPPYAAPKSDTPAAVPEPPAAAAAADRAAQSWRLTTPPLPRPRPAAAEHLIGPTGRAGTAGAGLTIRTRHAGAGLGPADPPPHAPPAGPLND